MSPERPKPLDTAALQAAYPPQELPPHKRFGRGQRYTFGSTSADVFSDPPELPPVVQIRMVKGFLAVGDVLHVVPTEAGGLHVDHANGACEIGNNGDVAHIYSAPTPERLLRVSPDGPIRTDVYGRSYTQTSLEVEGTPEGVRLLIFGVVDAPPRLVNSNKRDSALQFFLLEYNPQQPREPIKHEVWATNKAREKLKALKLKKEDSIQAIVYRHTYEVELQGGGKETHTRHNLAEITTVARKGDAKRPNKGHTATREG